MARDDVRVRTSSDLAAGDLAALRTLLDAAFEGSFSDDDWAHALGGTHALIETADGVIAHASVVPRVLDVGPQRMRAGYVEAVAVLPARRRTGLGTAVMRAIGTVIAGEFELGALATGEWRFYQGLGWERWRGPTWVRDPHGRLERSPDDDDSVMIMRTARTPAFDLWAPLTCDARPGDAW